MTHYGGADMEIRQPEKSYLFLVRVWLGDTTGEAGESTSRWQGKVQQVMGGGSGYVADISQLVDLVRAMLPPGAGDEASESTPQRASLSE
jgi:hypothetical protein